MISSLSHWPWFRVRMLWRLTDVPSLDAIVVRGGAAPFMAGGGRRRAVIVVRWLAGTGTLLRNPSLSRVAAAVEIVC